MAAVIGTIIGVIFVIYAIVSFTGDMGTAYSDSGCLGVLAFLFFACVLVGLVFVLGL